MPRPAAFQALTPPRRAFEFGNPSRMFFAACPAAVASSFQAQ
jgi:hypothetical protein